MTFLVITIILVSISTVNADVLSSSSASGSSTCTNQTYTNVASFSLDVTSINAVYLSASFTTKMASGTTTRTGYYIISATGALTSNSGEITRRLVSVGGADDKGIGSLVHIFDVSSVTGSVTFTLQHKNIEDGELITTSGTLVGIGLTTTSGGAHLDYDVQRVNSIDTDSLAVDTTWHTVSQTAAITNPAGGNIFIASSINSKKDNSSGTTGQGEWKFQFKQGLSGTWYDLGVSMSRSFADENAIGMTGSVSVLENQSSADFYFRLLNRLANLTSDTVVTSNINLVVFTLGTPSDGKTFPVYKVEGGPVATTSTSLVTALAKSITPSNAASLYLHAQYSMSASATSNAPSFDLYVNNGILNGSNQQRALADSDDSGSGMSVGLATGLLANTTYDMRLRHLSSSSGITLTTDDISLIGIQLSHNNDITWDGSEGTDWNTGDNWDGGVVPGSSDNVIIPNVTNDPAVTGTRSCYDLNLATGAVLSISGSGDLTVGGNLTNQGTVTVSATLGVSGSMNVQGGTLTINDPGGVTITNNLTTTGTVNVNKTLTVTGNTTVESGKLTVNSPGDYTVSGDYLWISGGEFELNDGTVTSTNEFWSSSGSTVDINGGTLDIGSDWGNNAGMSAKGTIELSGGNITVGDDARFSSSSSLIGSMSGSFSLTVGDNFHNNSSNWGTVTGGTITMTASKDGSCVLYSSNASNDVVAYNLTIDGSGDAFWIYKGGGENQGLHVFNDFTVTNGTVHTLGSTEHMDKLDVDGTFSLAAGTEFRDGIESTDTYSVNAYSFNSTSTYRFYSTADQNIPATTFGHVKVRDTGTKSITGNTTIAGDLDITAGELSVAAGYGLTVTGNLSNSATMTVKSSSETSSGSLIVGGTSTGNITYERYMTGSKWHLTASPFVGQDIGDFLTNAANAIVLNGSDYSMMDYSESSDAWNSYFTSATGGNFTAGAGYIAKRSSGGIVSFTGTLTTSDLAIGITRANYGWNLVSNPYPSAIGATSDAASSANFITVNSADLDPSYVALYVWDHGNTEYKIINNSGGTLDQDYLQAGQAFFVRSKTGGSTIDFTEAMQSHQVAIAFKSTKQTWPTIKLIAESVDEQSSTLLKFKEGMTLGLDISYDAGLFEVNPIFSLYTKLVEDNGMKFSIQCLPDNEYEDMVIPVIMNAPDGTEIKFRTEVNDLPFNYRVILEDRQTGIFTDLENHEESYTATLDNITNEVQRFYLHTQSVLLNIDDPELTDQFQIIPQKQLEQILIHGVERACLLSIYDLSGRLINKFELEAKAENSIPFPGVKPGIYVIQISTNKLTTSKKIIW